MSDVMIEAKSLTKRYGDVTALQKVSFEVKKGEVLGFLGPNGAGKTTTMKILTCFIAPTTGTAKVNGCDVFEDPIGVRSSLGYLAESNPLYTEMLVLEFLQWIAKMRGLEGDKRTKRLKKVVEETGIGDVIGKEIRALSKGYRQRVGLASTLLHEPPILILDEPMSGLDPNQTVEIRELIREIGRERTVIFSTHSMAEAEKTCDRLMIITKGQIVADDTAEGLRRSAGNKKYFATFSKGGDTAGTK
jgi:ABC-2 type transport system ATP-binding protein